MVWLRFRNPAQSFATCPTTGPVWIAAFDRTRFNIITGYAALRTRVFIPQFDSTTGMLKPDKRFRKKGGDEPGFRLERIAWPHDVTRGVVPHGAVFERQ